MKWFMKACAMYGLSEKIQTTLSSGLPLSREEWKSDVKSHVHSRHHILSYIERETYENLGHTSQSAGMDIWWDVAFAYPQYLQACRLMVKIKAGMEPLQINLAHTEGKDATKTCKMCQNGTENARHFLFVCPNLDEQRKDFKTMLHDAFNNATEILANNSVGHVVNPQKDKDIQKLGKLANSICQMYKYRQIELATLQK